MSWASGSERPRDRARSVAVDDERLLLPRSYAAVLALLPRSLSSVDSLFKTSDDIMLVIRENAPPEDPGDLRSVVDRLLLVVFVDRVDSARETARSSWWPLSGLWCLVVSGWGS